MQIELTKRADGGGTLRCIRVDRSITWRSAPRPLYDLTRFAVESSLGLMDGYWGAVASGVALGDADAAEPEGEALLSLRLAQKFDVELAGVIAWRAAELELGIEITEAMLDEIRTLRDRLFREWFAVLPGEPMLLRWPLEAE
ncbi:hypothetical protein F183_A17320 [Bryobacterales bacterium F-183]|nr:hypothetical protein F183_A17320 [Bryobacterales bacterium F-183]